MLSPRELRVHDVVAPSGQKTTAMTEDNRILRPTQTSQASTRSNVDDSVGAGVGAGRRGVVAVSSMVVLPSSMPLDFIAPVGKSDGESVGFPSTFRRTFFSPETV